MTKNKAKPKEAEAEKAPPKGFNCIFSVSGKEITGVLQAHMVLARNEPVRRIMLQGERDGAPFNESYILKTCEPGAGNLIEFIVERI